MIAVTNSQGSFYRDVIEVSIKRESTVILT